MSLCLPSREVRISLDIDKNILCYLHPVVSRVFGFVFVFACMLSKASTGPSWCHAAFFLDIVFECLSESVQVGDFRKRLDFLSTQFLFNFFIKLFFKVTNQVG